MIVLPVTDILKQIFKKMSIRVHVMSIYTNWLRAEFLSLRVKNSKAPGLYLTVS